MPREEKLTPEPGLLEKLSPLRAEISALSDNPQAQSELVQTWFLEHPENLARDVEDLTMICVLEYDERKLLTDPILGNWLMGQIDKLTPESPTQAEALAKTKEIFGLLRFHDSRFGNETGNKIAENNLYDELNALLISDPDTVKYTVGEVRKIMMNAQDGVMEHVLSGRYKTGLEHGILGPMDIFWYGTTLNFEIESQFHEVEPMDARILVLDDKDAEDWYKRLVAAGFKDDPDQQGHFTDPSLALVALLNGNYDVILSDLDLGEGQMSGIDFARIASAIQRAKGIKDPLISVFSYDQALLEEANRTIGRYSDNPVLFQQVNGGNNNKVGFTGYEFGRDVRTELYVRENFH